MQAGALAWLASMLSSDMHYSAMIVPFIMAGAGMALVFAPSANAVLASVTAQQAGQASGANNAIREVGGVLGVSVLASVFTGAGGYGSAHAFIAGLEPALWVAVAVLASGRAHRARVPVHDARTGRARRGWRQRPRRSARGGGRRAAALAAEAA